MSPTVREGRADLWIATRPTTKDPWGPATLLGGDVSTSAFDGEPALSADGLTLFFTSDRSGGLGGWDLWVTTRKNRELPWGPAVNLGSAVNTGAAESTPFVSPDMKTLYFGSTRTGSLGDLDIWYSPIVPVVDFNGDETVDIDDLIVLIEHWGQSESWLDIGPAPWGDGVIDAKDLEVLMSYWGQEVYSPSLVAYWKLDEGEGVVAFDSVGTSDGVLVGDPTWQATGGKLGGALQLDGVDDCVTTESVCDPSESPFSVLAWVKGGAPGQVIVSQDKGANWLMAGTPDGALATELKSSGRLAKPLKSP